jgi:hypothetical protein
MADGISRVGKEASLSSYSSDKAADEEQGGVTPRAQENLLALNPTLRGPIEQLLAWKIFDCAATPKYYPKNCFESVAYVTGLDYLTKRRTPAISKEPILDGPNKIKEMLASGGYVRTAAFFPFYMSKDWSRPFVVTTGLNLSAIPNNLKPGDILFFGGRSALKAKPDRFVHAAVYLGKQSDKHYVFDKPNCECGPGSPYGIVPLEDILKELVGQPAAFVDRVFVYRK